MSSSYVYNDDISLLGFKRELQGYSFEIFRADFIAAFSVALLTIPQAMAYALLAGLPLTAGIFAAIYSSILASIFGSSRHLIVGPSNTIAILVQTGTAEIIYTYYRDVTGLERDAAAIMILTQLSVLVGIVQILAAGCKLGRLTQFVSHSVIIAYIAGTAIAVFVNQLFTFLGVSSMPAGHSIYEKGVFLAMNLTQVHFPTALVGILSLVPLIILKKMNKNFPASLLSLAFAAVFVYVLSNNVFEIFLPENLIPENMIPEGSVQQYFQNVKLVGDTGSLYGLVPYLAFPHFNMSLMNSMLPFAFAVALLNIMETCSIAKTLAANSGQRLSVNQEIFGIGLVNLLSSFISAMPVSGSPSRSSLNYSLGAKTRVAAILNASIVAIFVLSFNNVIMLIPLAALSALLLYTSVNIVQRRQFFLCVKSTNSDAFVLWTTLFSCIFLSLDVAFYIGVVLSITLYLKKASIPQLVEYDIDESGELQNLDLTQAHEHRAIRLIKVEGELFFGAADLFQTTLKAIAEDDTSTRVIILQLKNARDIDATVCLALHHLDVYLKSSSRYLIACGMTQQIWDVLSDSGLVEQIGKENLFIFDERHPHQHMSKALKRAKFLAALQTIAASSETLIEKPVVINSPKTAASKT